MKRILTLALAAILVVAFAIPTFAAPKIELVGGTVETTAKFGTANWWGTQNIPNLYDLKFKLSADNLTFSITLDPNIINFTITDEEIDDVLTTVPADGITRAFQMVTDYNFSLALPYLTLSGYFDSYNKWCEDVWYGPIHISRELRLGSDEKFKELTGFEWAVYLNDSKLGGDFDSMHAQLTVPVGEAFSAVVNYAREDGLVWDDTTGTVVGKIDAADSWNPNQNVNLNLTYNFTEELYANVVVAKDLTADFTDFFFDATVGFPIIEGISGTFYAQYGMADFVGDTDFNNYGGYWHGWFGDTAEAYIDLAYNNEAANAELFVDYAAASDFTTGNLIIGFAEYVSNGGNSWWSSNNRRANYADTNDPIKRGWNSKFDWVRKNSGNEFAVRVDGRFVLDATPYPTDEFGNDVTTEILEANQENTYVGNVWAMFAPDMVPVVVTLKGTYTHGYYYNYDDATTTLDETYYTSYAIHNWIGIRITPDIHMALWNRYMVNDLNKPETAADESYSYFDMDASFVYSKDSVTAKLTGTNLLANAPGTTQGVELYLGLSF